GSGQAARSRLHFPSGPCPGPERRLLPRLEQTLQGICPKWDPQGGADRRGRGAGHLGEAGASLLRTLPALAGPRGTEAARATVARPLAWATPRPDSEVPGDELDAGQRLPSLGRVGGRT